MTAKKGGLGRGLDALFDQNATNDQTAVELRLSDIEPNRSQPRQDFDEQALMELADSIRMHGILQPLLVRPLAGSGYQIVAGERRWRAARMAGLSVAPVVIRELSDAETAEIALIENLQREDLNAVEEALGYKTLLDKFGLTQEQVADKVGKSRPVITNAVRLLALPDPILQLLRNGKITSGHARALLSFSDAEQQAMAAKLAESGASVREIERMAKRNAADAADVRPKEAKKDAFFSEVELSLCEALGRKVRILSGKGKGMLEIEFYGKDDLRDIANRLAGE